MNSKIVWYQSYIDRINEILKEFDSSTFEHRDFTKNKLYEVHTVFKKGENPKRLVFMCSKFQKKIDIYTKEL